eukprot:Platyproteum_vivax@DN4148_c0_g1_i1.p1
MEVDDRREELEDLKNTEALAQTKIMELQTIIDTLTAEVSIAQVSAESAQISKIDSDLLNIEERRVIDETLRFKKEEIKMLDEALGVKEEEIKMLNEELRLAFEEVVVVKESLVVVEGKLQEEIGKNKENEGLETKIKELEREMEENKTSNKIPEVDLEQRLEIQKEELEMQWAIILTSQKENMEKNHQEILAELQNKKHNLEKEF